MSLPNPATSPIRMGEAMSAVKGVAFLVMISVIKMTTINRPHKASI